MDETVWGAILIALVVVGLVLAGYVHYAINQQRKRNRSSSSDEVHTNSSTSSEKE